MHPPLSRFDVSGRVVIVTGGSRGLGRAMALGFGECGARVAVTSRSFETCRFVVDEIAAAGGGARSRWGDAVVLRVP